MITRQTENGEKKELSHLDVGETFGERSLISNEPSDVAVEMLSDGMVMKIPKNNFNELVKTPMLNMVSVDEANSLLAEGASFIDVRNPNQYKESAIKNSINLDLENIYSAVKGLNIEKKYIICGDSESHAMANAFMLSVKGFTIYSLSESVTEYLNANPDAVINVQKAVENEVPAPVLETTMDKEDLPMLATAAALEKTADNPPQIRINTESISENMQDISKDLELQIRKEINDLYILKQKELELEINDRFKKYHMVTARIMKKKLDDLELVYQVQAKMAKKT